MDIDNNKVDVNTQSKFQSLLDMLVRAISGSSKDSDVVEVEDQAASVVTEETSKTHQEGDKTVSQSSSELVVTEEGKEISETHLENDNPEVLIEEDLHAAVVSDNLDQAAPVVTEETSKTHQEGETVSQSSSELVVTEEGKEISETHLENDNPEVLIEEDLHAAVVSDNLDQAVPAVTEEEVSEQNLLDMLVRAILGSSKDSDVVEVEDQAASVVTEETSKTHQEGDKTVSQSSSELVVTEEGKEISETHLENDNPEVLIEEDLHAAVVSDNLDQAVPAVTEEEVSEQNLLDMLVRAILGSSKDSDVVEVEDQAASVVTEETSKTHQEGDKTVSQSSSELVVAEEGKEISETHLENDNPEVLIEEDLHAAVVSDNLDQAASVVTEETSKTHQEGDKTVSQSSSELVVTEEGKEISETHLENDNPEVLIEEDLHAAVVSDNL
ncbi:ehrlichia tandem repeat family protein, partial [Ehrlichia cf. muris str. EmCRT]